jgi:ribulose-5-phosphate 4-epimerase/fuculose-1-phosphate aldolase
MRSLWFTALLSLVEATDWLQPDKGGGQADCGLRFRPRRLGIPLRKRIARSAGAAQHSAFVAESSAMDGNLEPRYRVNEYTPDPCVAFDRSMGETYVKYARMMTARGYVQSTLGGMAIRAAHPGYEHGICYAKPQGVSLEEVEAADLVITDIPYGRILHGERATTVGHQMNREILRLRPDVNCVIHLHHDETIAFLAAGFQEIRSTSLTFSYLMQKPAAYLPASLNVEEDVGPIKDFIQDTNCIIMRRHGFTVLGRSVSEAYHRTNVLVSEVKRNIIAETLAAGRGTTPEYLSPEDMAWMMARGDAVVYPTLLKRKG